MATVHTALSSLSDYSKSNKFLIPLLSARGQPMALLHAPWRGKYVLQLLSGFRFRSRQSPLLAHFPWKEKGPFRSLLQGQVFPRWDKTNPFFFLWSPLTFWGPSLIYCFMDTGSPLKNPPLFTQQQRTLHNKPLLTRVLQRSGEVAEWCSDLEWGVIPLRRWRLPAETSCLWD